MRILLSYTTKHYDPEKDDVIYGHTVGREAQIYYRVLKEFGDVHYIDNSSTDVTGEEYDLLVSLPRNFGFLTSKNKFKKTICHLNIPEPSYLYTVMKANAEKIGCKLSDCFRPRNFWHADKYILMGGDFNRNHFVSAGIPSEKIVDIVYGMDDMVFKDRDKNEVPVFLHVATTLGLRKGFYYVVTDFLKANLDAKLWCVGRVQNEKFWIDFANKAAQDPRIEILGWIEQHDPRYQELFHKADFFMFPSWGEGQPGTVMEAIASGTVPIVSEQSGVNYYPVNKYMRGDASIWKTAAEMSNTWFRGIQREMKVIIEKKGYTYKNFEAAVRNTVKEVING